MKLLLAQNLVYLPTFNGASKANRALLEGLAAGGHSCRVVAQATGGLDDTAHAAFVQSLVDRGIRINPTTDADIFTYHGVEVHAVRNPARIRAYLVEQIRTFEPTWTIVSTEDPGQVLLEAALKTSPARVVYLTHI